MKANKLTPRHAAPVQREINTTSSEGRTSTGLTPHSTTTEAYSIPFAGDDAEQSPSEEQGRGGAEVVSLLGSPFP